MASPPSTIVLPTLYHHNATRHQAHNCKYSLASSRTCTDPSQRITILTLLGLYLASRARSISLLYNNHPDRLVEVNRLPHYAIKYADRIRNCEDAVMVPEDGLAILSCDPGRDRWNTVMGTFTEDKSLIPHGDLTIYRYTGAEDDDKALTTIKLVDFPEIDEFHPLGVEYHRPSGQLFVCNHHYAGSRVEIFSLDLSDPRHPTAHHQRTLIDAAIRAPNAILALSAHELYITNDHHYLQRTHPKLAKTETLSGAPGGALIYANTQTGEMRRVARIPFANGVARVNASTVAVASSSTAAVYLYEVQPRDYSVRFLRSIPVPFFPDNLETDQAGVLLIAGHPSMQGLEATVKERLQCTGVPSKEEGCYKAGAPSWVAEWTQERGVRDLYVTRGEFGSSSTAGRDAERGVGLATGLYERGILVWRESGQ